MQVALLRRAAGFHLVLTLVFAAFTVGVFWGHLLEWLFFGGSEHVTLGDVLGIRSRWLGIPMCVISLTAALTALYMFCCIWSASVRKDIDSTPPRA